MRGSSDGGGRVYPNFYRQEGKKKDAHMRWVHSYFTPPPL